MASAPDVPSTERLIGRYALYDEIASGGMATVHFGRMVGAVGFARTVAIKRLHAQYSRDQDFVEMFLDEARLAARIQHPNVVSTLDVVSLDGELFLVMEYVKGETLSRLLRAAKKLGEAVPPRILVNVVVGMLHGLHAAHEAHDEKGNALGIVHRDVSPQNVIVGVDGVARLLDFGVAKAAGRLSSTRDGQLKGKFAYMSPEQVQGGEIDRRTDVYAAAVVLWEGLAGRRLIEGENEATLLQRVLTEEIVPPSKLRPDVPKALDDVVMKGLERDPSKRFASAREMSNALEEASPMASQREVGEWVETSASVVLAQRAEKIKELESRTSARIDAGDMATTALSVVSASKRRVAAAAGDEDAATTFYDGKSTAGGTGSSSGFTAATSTRATTPPPAGTGRVVLAALAGAVLVLCAVGVGAFVFGPRAATPLAVVPAPSAPATEASVVPSSLPVTAARPDDSAAAALPADSAAPAISVANVPRRDKTAPKNVEAKPVKPTAKADCDPPYTVDASGIRRIKPQCF